jgi:hypothetical protein
MSVIPVNKVVDEKEQLDKRGLRKRRRGYPRVARWLLFKPKIPILGKFWRALELKMLIHFVSL